MCGIVGIVGKSNVNQALYDALTVLQHRGQDAAGIVTSHDGRLFLRKDNGLVRDVFHQRHMQRLVGHMGIGHVRYPTAGSSTSAEAQPFYVNSPYGITLAHNGNLTNVEQLAKEIYESDLRHVNTSSDSEVLLNVFAHELAQRGKLHNPVTGSGGMLIGTVRQIGPALADKIDLKVGDKIATLVSLSLTPLRIDEITKIHLHKDQIDIRGQAILFETGLYARLPADIDEKMALAILDVAGAPAQTARLVKPGDTVVVMGGGGKSGTLCVYEARKRAGPTGCIIGVSPFAKDCERMKALGWVDHALQVDATHALALMEAVAAVTGGKMADVVINCVNIPHTEMASILATRQHGKIYFFSMATSFTAAALGAEGVGKDVEMLVGNGYASGHAQHALVHHLAFAMHHDHALDDALARVHIGGRMAQHDPGLLGAVLLDGGACRRQRDQRGQQGTECEFKHYYYSSTNTNLRIQCNKMQSKRKRGIEEKTRARLGRRKTSKIVRSGPPQSTNLTKPGKDSRSVTRLFSILPWSAKPSAMPHTTVSFDGSCNTSAMMRWYWVKAACGQVSRPRPRAATMMFCRNIP